MIIWSLCFYILKISLTLVLFMNQSYGEVRMIWKYPHTLDITSRAIIEKMEKNSTCDLSTIDDNVTIDSLQVVFMTNRCIGGYCRNPVRDRGVEGLMLIECSDIFRHIQDLSMDTIALLEDECNACLRLGNDSTFPKMNVKNVTNEEEKSWWPLISYWNFWKSSPSK